MTYEEAREARLRQPFRPFTLTLMNGQVISILEPVHIAVGPEMLGVVDQGAPTGFFVPIKQVAALTYLDESIETKS